MPSTRPAAIIRRLAALSFARSFVMPTMLLDVLIGGYPPVDFVHRARSALGSLPPPVSAIFRSFYDYTASHSLDGFRRRAARASRSSLLGLMPPAATASRPLGGRYVNRRTCRTAGRRPS